ncbi:MAG: 30S ribosomal protein S18 [Candidatus Blackburnbacteria bacterium]|nr:30S ribosomal protein S18 [Candidatus Blackburnbacteria bacterium]
MVKKKKQQKKEQERIQRQPKNLSCPFCAGEQPISYKDAEGLLRFVSNRGKISSRGRSGVCARHQRELTRQIKRARQIGLLPFVISTT